MELLLLNRALTSSEALEWGLVNSVVEDSQLLDEALRMAERLSTGATHAFGKTKRLLAASIAGFESQMVLESETIASQAITEEGAEGIHSFVEKRKPDFSVGRASLGRGSRSSREADDE
jgi:2-(1,2-epoxy-1,2-dihydrophenyl)acetyl-CoA isomerase